ncbi:MAG: nitroreductase/quinone reductase family protein, partial [Acidimicrobiia bacterium]
GLTSWIGKQTWLRPLAPLVSPVDRVLLSKFGRRMTPFPTLLLTTIGRNSGRTVDTPLWYLEEGRKLAMIAFNFGRHEPDWSRNLRANPTCTVKIRRRTTAYLTRPAEGEAWGRYLERLVEFYPTYRDYIAGAGREVPI